MSTVNHCGASLPQGIAPKNDETPGLAWREGFRGSAADNTDSDAPGKPTQAPRTVDWADIRIAPAYLQEGELP